MPSLSDHRITHVYSGLEYACAVSSDARLFIWGLNSRSGRLGLGDRDTRPPYPSYMQAKASRLSLPDLPDLRVSEAVEVPGIRRAWVGGGREMAEAGIRKVACGADAVWVLVEDGAAEVGRWAGK